MRYLEDSVHLDATPAAVWQWLTHMTDAYTDWHPDHVSAAWVDGPPNHVGSVMRAVERLGGHEEDLLLELTEIDPPSHFGYRIGRSIGLLVPRGSFDIRPDDTGGCWFTARIWYRFGRMTEKIFGGRLSIIRTHMEQEGRNLKRLVDIA